MLSFFPRDVLDEICDLIESVSEGFPTYSVLALQVATLSADHMQTDGRTTVRNHNRNAALSRPVIN